MENGRVGTRGQPRDADPDIARPADGEDEVQQSFRLLVASISDYAIFMLDPKGHVLSWNEGARRIKGYAASEVVGRHFSIFYEHADVQSGLPDWELIVAEREGRFEGNGWRVRRDGSKFWANVVITALRDETGELRGFGKVTRDNTASMLDEERRGEEQRRRSEELTQHADRMAQLEKVKRDFLNLASHELRGPLSVLRGYMSMVEDGTLSPDQFSRFVPLLSAKLRQMELLVRQMLETARMERGKLVLRGDVFDVGETLARVVESFQPLASHRHELKFLASDRPAVVTADEDRVEAVISNLVDNAIKYSPRGGLVSCMVATVANRVFVSVHDEGLGIAREDVPRLFVPFGRIVTPDNAHIGGTGLGLYLSREIVRQQGGDIHVESSLGSGSRFTLVLPLRQPDGPAPAG